MEDPSYTMIKSHRFNLLLFLILSITKFSFIFRSRDHSLYDHPSDYDRYGTPPPSSSKHSSAHHAPYESSSYERDYRRDYHPHSSSYAAAAYAGELVLV